jgi:hypothetical protein
MASSIFISYRRGAAAGTAGRLYDVFSARFGDEHVFMDVDSIHPGDDFVEILTHTLDRCQAMVVVIDPSWLKATGPAGQRRLDEPGDYVRLEIERALSRSIGVFPALIDNARMPTRDDLPPTISRLAHRQAVEISSTRFKFDAGRLLSAIERVVDTPLGPEQHDPRQPLAENRRAREIQGPHQTARDHAQAAAKRHGFAPIFGRSRTIRASLEDTWGALVDLPSYPLWYPICRGIKLLTDGPVGVGTKWESRLMLLRTTIVNEVLAIEPYQYLVIRQGDKRVVATIVIALSADGANTVVYFSGNYGRDVSTPWDRLRLKLAGWYLANLARYVEP